MWKVLRATSVVALLSVLTLTGCSTIYYWPSIDDLSPGMSKKDVLLHWIARHEREKTFLGFTLIRGSYYGWAFSGANQEYLVETVSVQRPVGFNVDAGSIKDPGPGQTSYVTIVYDRNETVTDYYITMGSDSVAAEHLAYPPRPVPKTDEQP